MLFWTEIVMPVGLLSGQDSSVITISKKNNKKSGRKATIKMWEYSILCWCHSQPQQVLGT